MYIDRSARFLFVAFLALAGCSDSAHNASDAASANDASVSDGGATLGDTGTIAPDMGATSPDVGMMASDTGVDAGSTRDAAVVDAGVVTDSSMCTATRAAIGARCTTPADCASGFTCQSVSGIVLTQSCQIRCDAPGSTCPCGTRCTVHNDKTAMPWHQCDI